MDAILDRIGTFIARVVDTTLDILADAWDALLAIVAVALQWALVVVVLYALYRVAKVALRPPIRLVRVVGLTWLCAAVGTISWLAFDLPSFYAVPAIGSIAAAVFTSAWFLRVGVLRRH